MKLMRGIGVVVLSLSVVADVLGQGFINLNFENATITPVASPGGVSYTATLPGWTWDPHANYVNGDLSSVIYNNIALDSPYVTLQGTNSPYEPAIQGSYSVFLEGGSPAVSSNSYSSIWQTGRVPATAQSIIYWGGPLQVTFNGQPLSFNSISNAPNYTVWAADISAYAGQTGQLKFTAPWTDYQLLDNIQFSSSPAPEPGAFGIMCISLLCGIYMRGGLTSLRKNARPR